MENYAIKVQAKHLAGIYKRLYMNDRVPQFMCVHAEGSMPELHAALCTTFSDKNLFTVLMHNSVPGVYYTSRWPNAVRHEYLRYIGRYGKMPPWKLVHQWVLETNQLEFAELTHG